MSKVNQKDILNGLIDLSKFETTYEQGAIHTNGDPLINMLYAKVMADGYAVCYNIKKTMLSYGLDIRNDKHSEIARTHLEDVYRLFATRIELDKFNPIDAKYDRIVKMDVDGYNVNLAFSPNNEHTPTRRFITTKCVHFDAATPFIANIYGPNKNIVEGYPVICDTKSFCIHKRINPFDLVENIPNNYNVVVKEKYYQELLSDYSFALDIDMANDLVMIILHNEVNGGVAHAATQPKRQDVGVETVRPIRHLEYQFKNASDLEKWYRCYGMKLELATDYEEKVVDLSMEYGGRIRVPFTRVIRVRQ